jgi:hypothetical protein
VDRILDPVAGGKRGCRKLKDNQNELSNYQCHTGNLSLVFGMFK